MAVTLFCKRKVINNIIIRNGVKKKEETPKEEVDSPVKRTPPKEVQARLRGKMYARRTINR